MKGLKSIIFAAAALIAVPTVVSSCSDWTEPEAEDFYKPQTPAYKNNLKDYFASPHKVMFGWFGSWSTGGKGNQLVGLPDSTDFVSLWLVNGRLTKEQQADLKEFQKRGSKAILCWRAADIVANLIPDIWFASHTVDQLEEFWEYDRNDVNSRIEAAKKYAYAIVDTCDKYNIDGFDFDMEDEGTLSDSNNPEVVNTFLRTLREEFDKRGKMLCVDIPGAFRGEVGSSSDPMFFRFFKMLDDDVLENVDYIIWQTYELDHEGLDWFYDRVQNNRPALFDKVLGKSIITATFEHASEKDIFKTHQTYRNHTGLPHAGIGAYHIEYDYPGNPDYPYVRAGISAQNPPINN